MGTPAPPEDPPMASPALPALTVQAQYFFARIWAAILSLGYIPTDTLGADNIDALGAPANQPIKRHWALRFAWGAANALGAQVAASGIGSDQDPDFIATRELWALAAENIVKEWPRFGAIPNEPGETYPAAAYFTEFTTRVLAMAAADVIVFNSRPLWQPQALVPTRVVNAVGGGAAVIIDAADAPCLVLLADDQPIINVQLPDSRDLPLGTQVSVRHITIPASGVPRDIVYDCIPENIIEGIVGGTGGITVPHEDYGGDLWAVLWDSVLEDVEWKLIANHEIRTVIA